MNKKQKTFNPSNKTQKAFLNTLRKSMDQALRAQAGIFKALEIGGVPIEQKKACLKYAMALQEYAEAAHRMTIDCTIAFGRPSNAIAIETMVNNVRNN